jgi:hypothetical protein
MWNYSARVAAIVNKPALDEVAAKYRGVAQLWRAFAEAATPDSIEPLKVARGWLKMRRDVLLAKGGEAFPEVTPITQKLNALRSEYNKQLPIDDATMNALFGNLAEQLNALYEAETGAVATLKEAIS